MGIPLVLVNHVTNISSFAGLMLASIGRICQLKIQAPLSRLGHGAVCPHFITVADDVPVDNSVDNFIYK